MTRTSPTSRYFLAAGFDLSCFGFRFFLSFFCELFPLPMLEAPVSGWLADFRGRLPMQPPTHSIGRIGGNVEFRSCWPACGREPSEPRSIGCGRILSPAVESGMANSGKPKTLIVYKSVHHGNTARIAREIAGVLGADCAEPAECPYERLAGCELLGIGSGVYYGQVHDEIREWVRDLPEDHAHHVQIFIVTTSGLPMFWKLWHWPLKAQLTKKGYAVIGEFACRGFDTWGPLWLTGGLNRRHPDERDLQRARTFARQLERTSGLCRS